LGSSSGGANYLAGAETYARFYKKRLPTMEEWKRLMTLLAGGKEVLPGSAAPSGPEGGYMQMMPATDGKDAGFESATSSGRIPPVREWLAGEPSGSGAANKKEEEIINRVAKWPMGNGQSALQRRYPWEGFSDVGFRTVMDAGIVRTDR
jgi:hypothetical protein